MAQWLTDSVVKNLEPPATGNRITYDGDNKKAVPGFGVRVTANGARSFILNYWVDGREFRYTIGPFSEHADGLTVVKARAEVARLREDIRAGHNPVRGRRDRREAPTVDDLVDRFIEEYLPSRRASTQADYNSIIKKWIRPELGKLKVVAVDHADIDRLHRKIAKDAPYRANRTMAVLSKMFNLACSPKWKMRADNPVRGIERRPEYRRERYLKPKELVRLAEAMADHREKASVNAIRLLLLTGARRGETLRATWSQFDFDQGVWTKPAAATKTDREHRVPLSAPARALLTEMKAEADKHKVPSSYVFPGDTDDGPLTDIKNCWRSVTRKATVRIWAEDSGDVPAKLVSRLTAELERAPTWAECARAARIEGIDLPAGLTDARIHDLRHTYASVLASAGLSLPIIGALLGHMHAATTQRYAHLLDDPLRRATETAGAIISPSGSADLMSFSRRPK